MAKINLRSIGTSLLSANKTFPAAVAALAEQAASNDDLRTALAADYLKRLPHKKRAAPPHSRRREGRHRRPRGERRTTPTQAQKTAALKAEKTYVATAWDRKMRGGRKFGDIRNNEVVATAGLSGEAGLSFLARGYEDWVDFFACTMAAKYCVAADPFAKLRDTIKLSVATAILERAKIAAAEAQRDVSTQYLQHLTAKANAIELPAP